MGWGVNWPAPATGLAIAAEFPPPKTCGRAERKNGSIADMRTLICLVFIATALGLHAQGQVFFGPERGFYAGDLPNRSNAPVVFHASIGGFNRPGLVKMQLIGRNAGTVEDVILFVAPVTRRNGLIKVEFPFGGRFVGRHNSEHNSIVGHFSGFAHGSRPNIPRQRFEMASLTNVMDVGNFNIQAWRR